MGSSVILRSPGQPGPMKPGEFEGAAVPNASSFSFVDLQPPSQIYINRDDKLGIFVRNSSAGTQVVIRARVLLPSLLAGRPGQPDRQRSDNLPSSPGFIQTFQQIFIVTSDKTGNSFTVDLTEGFLLSVTAAATATFPTRGQTWIRLSLLRGTFTVGAIVHQLLTQDYVTADGQIGWPGGQIRSATEGPGFVHSIQVANPGAGVEWIFTASFITRTRILSTAALLTTSVAVANRLPQLAIDDGANIVFAGQPSVSVPASQAVNTSGSTSTMQGAANVVNVMIPLPNSNILMPGWRIRSSTSNLQAGDTYTNIWLAVEEWIDD